MASCGKNYDRILAAMNPVLFTIYEGDYHYGVAAIINSAIKGGFDGMFCIFHRGPLPPWTRTLKQLDENSFEVAERRVDFRHIQIESYLGYEKPRAALDVFSLYPECDTVLYADPDIVFLAQWKFFRDWLSQGVAFCLDANFPYLPAEHPWRKTWGILLEAATGKKPHSESVYPNGGFFGVRRQDKAFLEDWFAITEQYRKQMGELTHFRLGQRHLAVVGDQDLMASALMGWTGEKSILGPEGMGFTGHHFILSHDINQPKAWRRRFFLEALKGNQVPRAADMFLEASRGPIQAWSKAALTTKRYWVLVAKTLTRVWQRPST
jgi:hypothetical protein